MMNCVHCSSTGGLQSVAQFCKNLGLINHPGFAQSQVVSCTCPSLGLLKFGYDGLSLLRAPRCLEQLEASRCEHAVCIANGSRSHRIDQPPPCVPTMTCRMPVQLVLQFENRDSRLLRLASPEYSLTITLCTAAAPAVQPGESWLGTQKQGLAMTWLAQHPISQLC